METKPPRRPRYTLNVRARLYIGGEELTVRTVDVGEGGIGVISPVEISAEGEFLLKLEFAILPGVFEAVVRVIRRNGFRYGLKFVALDEANLALLKSYQRRWGIHADAAEAGRR